MGSCRFSEIQVRIWLDHMWVTVTSIQLTVATRTDAPGYSLMSLAVSNPQRLHLQSLTNNGTRLASHIKKTASCQNKAQTTAPANGSGVHV